MPQIQLSPWQRKKSMHACTHIHTHLTPCTQTGSSQASAPLPPTLLRALKMVSVSPHGYDTAYFLSAFSTFFPCSLIPQIVVFPRTLPLVLFLLPSVTEKYLCLLFNYHLGSSTTWLRHRYFKLSRSNTEHPHLAHIPLLPPPYTKFKKLTPTQK